jgi:Na+-translocating ferredoxin:NAD+ oxidoreductase RnfD subunit
VGVAAAPWYVILPVLVVTGLFITDRVNRLPMAGVFLATYYGTATLLAFGGLASRLAETYEPPFVNAVLFAALVMLTDPPTSPAKRADQIRYGVVCALVSIAFVAIARQLYFLPLGLLAGNVWLVCSRVGRRTAVRRTPTEPLE